MRKMFTLPLAHLNFGEREERGAATCKRESQVVLLPRLHAHSCTNSRNTQRYSLTRHRIPQVHVHGALCLPSLPRSCIERGDNSQLIGAEHPHYLSELRRAKSAIHAASDCFAERLRQGVLENVNQRRTSPSLANGFEEGDEGGRRKKRKREMRTL